jgi:alkylation response protein AidB-like acyl-CoA dehydrogenase
MDLTYTPAQEELRRRVRTWLDRNLPRRERQNRSVEYGDVARLPAAKAWQRRLYEAGYVAMGWPREHGGRGADILEQTIVEDELVRARAPGLIGLLGVQMVGPTLIQWGTDEQKRRFLPAILTADELWCQGYSEPDAGSDLASLRTRAELDGDKFVVNGQKVWTSYAHLADWMFCLVRTNPSAPRHHGVSYLLIDMRSPGITVRPLVQITGDAGFNEVFLENVRVPRRNLVGALDQGWQVANSTLKHERHMLGSTARTQQLLNGVIRLARLRRRNGHGDEAVVRQRLADLATRVEAMRLDAYRQTTDEVRGRAPGIGASITKLASTELNHDLASFALTLLGSYGPLAAGTHGVVDDGLWPYELMFTLGMIIGGGTSQIQKNIISERGLGMPRQ